MISLKNINNFFDNTYLKKIIFFLIIVSLLGFLFYPIIDYHIWEDLALGKYIENNHVIPNDINIFSFGKNRIPFYSDSWLYAKLIFAIEKVVGISNLNLIRFIIIIGFFVLLYILLEKDSLYLSSIFFISSAFILGNMLPFSPLLLLTLFVFIFLYLYIKKGFSYKYLFLYIPLLLLITQFTYKSFFIIILSILLNIVFLFINIKIKEKRALYFLIGSGILLLMFLPLFVNKLFINYTPTVIYLIKKNFISQFSVNRLIYIVYPIIASIMAFIFSKEKRLYLICVIVYFTLLYFIDPDFIVLMIIASLLIIAGYSKDLSIKLSQYKLHGFQKIRNIILRILELTGVIIFIIFILSNDNYKNYYIQKYLFPENPVHFIKGLNIKGKILNPPEYGGYLEFYLNPSLQIYTDIKSIKRSSIIRNVYREIMEGDTLWKEQLSSLDVDMVLIDFITLSSALKSPYIWDFLYESGWKLVFFDDKFALFLKDKPEYSSIIDKYSFTDFDPFKKNSVYTACKKDAKHVIEKCSNIIIFAKDSYNLNMFIAIGYTYLGKYNIASRFFKRAISINPNGYNAYNNLGYMYIKESNWNKALIAFERSFDINPKFDKGYFRAALCSMEMKNYTKAEKYIKKAISINKYDPQYYLFQISLYEAMGDAFKLRETKKALKNLQKEFQKIRKQKLKNKNINFKN